MDKDRWDDISSDYDKSVEENTNPIIMEYLKKEMEILEDICKGKMQKNEKLSIIDIGSGTGRVLFALNKILNDDSISFYGIDNSEHMIKRANSKNFKENKNIKFIQHDSTDPSMCDHFEESDTNIVMCLYNTLGVITPSKRKLFFENLKKIVGKKGLIIISIFNGDNFEFTAPVLYLPMKQMIKQIDEDSFDRENKLFKNSLGYKSQWFTKNQITKFLESSLEPTPISVNIQKEEHVLGYVFTKSNHE